MGFCRCSSNLTVRCVFHANKDLTLTSQSCKVKDLGLSKLLVVKAIEICSTHVNVHSKTPRSFRTQVRCVQNWSCNLGYYAALDGMSQWSWESKLLLLFHKLLCIDSVKSTLMNNKKLKIRLFIHTLALSCNSYKGIQHYKLFGKMQ